MPLEKPDPDAPPEWNLANAPGYWSVQIAAFTKPGRKQAAWNGRWWSMWGASDLVAMGQVVCQVAPAMSVPFDAATTEFRISGKDSGVIAKTSAYNSPGQAVRLVRDRKGNPAALWVGGTQLLPKEAMLAEVSQRYRKAAASAGLRA